MINSSELWTKNMPLEHGAGHMPVLGFGTLIPDTAATVSATRDVLEAGSQHLGVALFQILAARRPHLLPRGLEADLQRCLTEWQSYGCIDPFPLSADDSSDRLLMPEKPYVREREVSTLVAAIAGAG
jgi:hypothetical protein